MNGHLSEHPLAELIQEIANASLTGALRLERERVKVVVYFEEGKLVYATSNLRAHRLFEVIKRSGLLTEAQLNVIGGQNDAELAAALLGQGILQPSALGKLRIQQVSDVLRPALLWIDGQWSYDPRVRLAEGMRIEFEPKPLLMEGARRLPREFIGARFRGADDAFSPLNVAYNGTTLLPAEASLLSRIPEPLSISQLKVLTSPKPTEALCIAYTLALGGFLQRSNWPTPLATYYKTAPVKTTSTIKVATTSPAKPVEDKEKAARANEERQVSAMLSRLSQAENHYEVLDVGREATSAEIKRAYHGVARSFHPDKFHKSVSREKHAEVEAAFARFAQAYETLGNPSLRSAYDVKLGGGQAAVSSAQSSSGARTPVATTQPEGHSGPRDPSYAETRFQQGLAALKQENFMLAVRCFAEAANLAPDEAKYRGYYGTALASQPQARRQAEAELMVAVALDPANASYHVMLARLYRDLGFSRRAQTELERALALEPGNEATQQLLSTLKKG
ncbi:MAG: DUF4388 domain-containing protein [Pyrinomonadaceae bacterium]